MFSAELVYQVVKRCFTQKQWDELAQSPDFFIAVTQARDAVDVEDVVDLGWTILERAELQFHAGSMAGASPARS